MTLFCVCFDSMAPVVRNPRTGKLNDLCHFYLWKFHGHTVCYSNFLFLSIKSMNKMEFLTKSSVYIPDILSDKFWLKLLPLLRRVLWRIFGGLKWRWSLRKCYRGWFDLQQRKQRIPNRRDVGKGCRHPPLPIYDHFLNYLWYRGRNLPLLLSLPRTSKGSRNREGRVPTIGECRRREKGSPSV